MNNPTPPATEKMRAAFKAWCTTEGLDYVLGAVGRKEDMFVAWQAAHAHLLPALTEARDALNWSRVMIKFHVKPERCVEIGDNVKSAIAIYDDAHKALANLNAVIDGGK